MGVCDVNRFTSIIVLLLVLAFLSSPLLVSIAYAAEDSWVTLAPIPTKRFFLGVAAVDGKIYAIGGAAGAGGVNATEMYDPVTNTWHTKASMPTPRSGFGIAVVENKIYVIGGSRGGYDYTNVNEVYDPETDTWETLTPMPTPRMSLDANVVNGKIYMIGGFNYTWPYYCLDETEVYDTSIDSWTTKTPIPTATDYYASAVVDNKIYIIGGGGGPSNQIYDPETDTWSNGTSLPKGVDGAAAGATTGEMAPKRIYVIGGKQNLDAVNLTQIYDPETDTWSTGTAMPTSRYGLGVAIVNDVVYAIGGVTGWIAPTTATNEQYTPAGYIPEFPSWTPTLLILIVLAVAVAIYKRKLPKTDNSAIILGD